MHVHVCGGRGGIHSNPPWAWALTHGAPFHECGGSRAGSRRSLVCIAALSMTPGSRGGKLGAGSGSEIHTHPLSPSALTMLHTALKVTCGSRTQSRLALFSARELTSWCPHSDSAPARSVKSSSPRRFSRASTPSVGM